MPQHQMVIPHYLGRSREAEVESKNIEDNSKGIKRQDSFSSRSSLQDIPLLLPQEPEGLDGSNGDMKSNGLEPTTTKSVSFRYPKAKIEPAVMDTPMKGFVDEHDSLHHHLKISPDVMTQPVINTSDTEWWETQERGDQMGSPDESGQVGPRASCRCQVCYSCRPTFSYLARYNQCILRFLIISMTFSNLSVCLL